MPIFYVDSVNGFILYHVYRVNHCEFYLNKITVIILMEACW